MRNTRPYHNRLRRLLLLALPEWKQLSWGFAALLISSGMVLIYPRAARLMIDEILSPGRFDRLHSWIILLFLAFLFQALASAFRYYAFTTAGERIVSRLRQKLHETILQQDIAFFDSRKSGELMNRLAADATIIQNAVTLHLSSFLQNLAIALGGFVLLIHAAPHMALGLFTVVPVMMMGAGYFGNRTQKFARASQEAWGLSAGLAAESISGIRTVRSFLQEKGEAQRYAEAVTQALHLGRLRIRSIALFIAVASLLGALTISAVAWLGGELVIQGKMSLGDLTSFLLYAVAVTVALGGLGSLWTEFMATLGASERVFELLDHAPGLSLAQGVIPKTLTGEIHFQKVTFHYPTRPDVPVLKDLSFSARPGEVIALVGPSGSGKSTIVSLLSRFYDPCQGSILLDGEDLRHLDGSWLRAHIGVVTQDPFLMSASIAANIRYGRSEAPDDAMQRAAADAYADVFIESFPDGYETLVGERGLQLSGGQRQRIAITRALLKDPPILILDEATSALDAESEHLVQKALVHLMQGRTTFVIAHRLSTVQHADRVLVMEHGRIIQSGTHRTLMQNTAGVYYRLAYRQLDRL
jgi:ATP-binding cassette subfamily B protein